MKKLFRLVDIQKPVLVSYDDGVSTNADATYTSATAVFVAADVGKAITGTNIPAGTTILSRTNATTIELSQNATASGTALHFTIVGREVTTVDLLAADVPAKSVIDRIVLIPTVVMAGGALSAAEIEAVVDGSVAGDPADGESLIGVLSEINELQDLAAPIQVHARVNLTGANLSELTTGEFEMHLFYTMLR